MTLTLAADVVDMFTGNSVLVLLCIAFVGAIVWSKYGDKIKAVVSKDTAAVKAKLPAGATDVRANLQGVIDALKGLGPVEVLDQATDDLRRGIDSVMLSKLRHRVEAETDPKRKDGGYAALEQLALIVNVPRSSPAAQLQAKQAVGPQAAGPNVLS